MITRYLRRIFLFAGILWALTAQATNSARFISQSVPHTMTAGMPYPVSVVMKNTGTEPWTADQYFLASRSPENNTNWGLGRVALAPGETIAPGQVKKFTFTVTAPQHQGTPGDLQSYPFNWLMVKEGVEWFGDFAPSVNVDVFYAPPYLLADGVTVDPAFAVPGLIPAPISASAGLFGSNFRGANILNQVYEDGKMCAHTNMLPDATQAAVILDQAVRLGLKYVRLPVIIPPVIPFPSVNDPKICTQPQHSEWWSMTDNNLNVNNVIAQAQAVMDAAQARDIKVVFLLDGYTKLTQRCYWKASYNEVAQNATTIINTFKTHPALLAWDVMNEPLWNAGHFGCLQNTQDTKTDIGEVVKGVHAMYQLVRSLDSTHMTTVGEAQTPYMQYWKDISSFATPHLYLSVKQNYENRTPTLNLDQISYVQGATITELKKAFGARPVIIGEWGIDTTLSNVPNVTDDDKGHYFEKFLAGLGAKNTGSLLWSMSLSADENQQSHSILRPDASFKPAADAVARAAHHTLAQQLYLAYLGRPMDPGALANVTNTLLQIDPLGNPAPVLTAQGLDNTYNISLDTRTMLDVLATSAESHVLYNYNDTNVLVSKIHQVAFNRTATPTEINSWANKINSGNLERNRAPLSIIAAILAGNSAQDLLDAETFRAKSNAAKTFTGSLNTAAWVNCYSGSAAQKIGYNLIAPVTRSTSPTTFQATVDAKLMEMAAGLNSATQLTAPNACQL
ncbi:glycoside hydrolase family 2 TIM barrel-domain containing protein [Pseudoduganella sp. UC29_106]|uniref:glycoside hydrolase family 2 TIM barrel-domain containing protein n=1 Tax=Pseudoduganella sp. UC29_106 TaxID=3374553 RepID=UPI003756951F